MDKDVKDALYYSDLIYKIKDLAGMLSVYDDKIEERIMKREEDILEEQENGIISYSLSIFQEEVFEIVRRISIKVGVPFKNMCEIFRYPELVGDVIHELVDKRKSIIDESIKNGTMDFSKVYVDLINTNIPKIQLRSSDNGDIPMLISNIPEEYRRKFVTPENGFVKLYCEEYESNGRVLKKEK